jgi:hypothetical protein
MVRHNLGTIELGVLQGAEKHSKKRKARVHGRNNWGLSTANYL